MPQELQGKRIAMLFTDGVEEVEYTRPRGVLEAQGAHVEVISPKGGGETIQGFDHLTPDQTFRADRHVGEAAPEDYDALVLPGGVANPDMLRLSDAAVSFVRRFAQTGKPLAAVCHGPWLLIDAGVAEGKRMTSWPTLRKDLENAGASWVDEEVVVDGNLITSRKPDDLQAFTDRIVSSLQQGQR